MRIRPLNPSQQEIQAIVRFTDREIGAGYYSTAELTEMAARSARTGTMYSLVLTDDEGEVQGLRLTFPPGGWHAGKGKGLAPERWPHRLLETAYFQSLFISQSLLGKGWGGRLSHESLQLLKSSRTRGVVCHSWKESPHGSSFRYLHKMGFKLIAEYPGYWSEVEYNCKRCQKPPCLCTAQEMYLDLDHYEKQEQR